jgi:hypothetical protein
MRGEALSRLQIKLSNHRAYSGESVMLRPFSDRAKFHRTDLTTNRRFAAGPASVHHALEYVYFTSARHLIAQAARDNMIRRLAPMQNGCTARTRYRPSVWRERGPSPAESGAK